MRFNRTRIAPTPSGFLHAGNLYGFLLTAALGRATGASILLRIDDLDSERLRPEYVADIFDTLQFFGIPWDEGPRDADTLAGRFAQQYRLPLYREALEKLRQTGLVYACGCSRAEIHRSAPDGIYPGTCRNKSLPLDQPGFAWRVRTDQAPVEIHELDLLLPDRPFSVSLGHALQIDKASIQLRTGHYTGGDFVVRKKDGMPAYQICSLVDDLHFQVDLVVRGEDLRTSTMAQLWLSRMLGYSLGETVFLHHPLLMEGGRKLSKSAAAGSLHDLRLHIPDPQDLLRRLDLKFPTFKGS